MIYLYTYDILIAKNDWKIDSLCSDRFSVHVLGWFHDISETCKSCFPDPNSELLCEDIYLLCAELHEAHVGDGRVGFNLDFFYV